MIIADSIWSTCVPQGLLSKYQRHLRHAPARASGRGRKREAWGSMVEDVSVTTKGVKHKMRSATTTAFPRPKTKEKCCLRLSYPTVLLTTVVCPKS